WSELRMACDLNYPLDLLAGGQSLRMGSPKGLLDYEGQPWLLEQLKRFEQAGGKRVVVVLGFFAEDYQKKIPLLKTSLQTPTAFASLEVTTVVNEEPAQGQF